jgi:hypothetical protein
MIFVSYSHPDTEWCTDLLTMAAPLMKQGIQFFADPDIAPGAAWRSTIEKALDSAAVAVLLVSRHFLHSTFIMGTELPYFLAARNNRGLPVLWVLVSDCLYEGTPLESIQAALPTSSPLEAMSPADRSRALKNLCGQIERAWRESETPKLNMARAGQKVQRRMENFQVLASPAKRRVEIFVRCEISANWYHQGAVLSGHRSLLCHFGNADTKPGVGFYIMAMTTDVAVPHPEGKPTSPLPEYRTLADGLRVIRE